MHAEAARAGKYSYICSDMLVHSKEYHLNGFDSSTLIKRAAYPSLESLPEAVGVTSRLVSCGASPDRLSGSGRPTGPFPVVATLFVQALDGSVLLQQLERAAGG